VFDAAGDFLGALSLAGPSVRFTEAALPRLEHAVLEAARDVTSSLGGPAQRYAAALERFG
jgi:DNA-binding IclR family transcriptional regulator